MVGTQGWVKLAKLAKKSSIYDVTHKKNPSPKEKILVQVQTTRLVTSFDTDQVRNLYRSGDIPAQSNVRSSCVFANRLN